MFSLPVKTNPRKNQVGLYNMFDDFFNDFPLFSKANDMKIDVRQTDKEYLIDAELPGMKKDNINIDVEENQLIISAYEQEEQEKKEQNYIHKERTFSSQRRAVYLPNIDEETISAKYTDGILSVRIPKKNADKKKKQITIE